MAPVKKETLGCFFQLRVICLSTGNCQASMLTGRYCESWPSYEKTCKDHEEDNNIDKYTLKDNDKYIYIKTVSKSNPRDLWTLRHVIRVMRTHFSLLIFHFISLNEILGHFSPVEWGEGQLVLLGVRLVVVLDVLLVGLLEVGLLPREVPYLPYLRPETSE